MTRAIKDTNQVERIQGIKVQLSGRLNGVEIARTEWIREGQLPLSTLRSKIDYIHREAQTLYGIIGIKVWVFYGLTP
jgi:small subunit ribosomal protein S3